jgi:hypothetical protein
VERIYRARKGYRFRTITGYREGAVAALQLGTLPAEFAACNLCDAFISKDEAVNAVATIKKQKTPAFYIDAPAGGNYYEGNGLHTCFFATGNCNMNTGCVREREVRTGSLPVCRKC